MFAKHYDVAWGCSCFEPLLISIWNILKLRPSSAQGSPRALLALPASSCSLPSCSRGGYHVVLVVAAYWRGEGEGEGGKAGAESPDQLHEVLPGDAPQDLRT